MTYYTNWQCKLCQRYLTNKECKYNRDKLKDEKICWQCIDSIRCPTCEKPIESKTRIACSLPCQLRQYFVNSVLPFLSPPL